MQLQLFSTVVGAADFAPRPSVCRQEAWPMFAKNADVASDQRQTDAVTSGAGATVTL